LVATRGKQLSKSNFNVEAMLRKRQGHVCQFAKPHGERQSWLLGLGMSKLDSVQRLQTVNSLYPLLVRHSVGFLCQVLAGLGGGAVGVVTAYKTSKVAKYWRTP